MLPCGRGARPASAREPADTGHQPPRRSFQRLRVLIDYRPALRERTGVGEYVCQLTRALARETARPSPDRLDAPDLSPADATVTVFSSSWKDRLDPGELAGLAWIDRRVPVQLLNVLWHRFEWPPIETLAGAEFEVAHSAHPLLMPSRRAARVVTIHDLDFLRHPERTRAEIRRDYPALVRSHARRADHIIVPSDHTARQVGELLGIPSEHVSVCPHGAPEWPARRNPPAEGHILFLGTLEPRKNVGALLQAYAALTERRPNVPPLVLGGAATPAATTWLEALERPPLKGRARHIGYVPPEHRRALYEDARVLVLPSFDEGFGLTVLEAMTIGVPVVASNRGALPELLGEAGLLVDPEDVNGLANAIERLVVDPEAARVASARGLERARRYTWQAAARTSLAAYARAVRTRHSRHAAPCA